MPCFCPILQTLLKGRLNVNEPGGISVSELNLLIAEAIRKEPRIRSITVRGEVSGFRPHLASGHWYFSLKDEEASVSCVMFRQNTFHARIKPRDGDRVLVSGYVDVYPKNGNCQLYCMSLRPDGAGDLFLQFEELKRRLSAEGLFDPSRKRILPILPRKVAVVTSGSGAAWHDILNVSSLRNPTVPIVLIPVTVQGAKAAAEIAEGIRTANEQTDADVIIVARGGGSAEDLWCFNDETVARAVAESRIPVVSGVGHEIDTTICDLAADVRASTPSNAAEIVFPDRKELRGRIHTIRIGLLRAAENETAKARTAVRETVLRLTSASPDKRIARLASAGSLRRTELIHALHTRLENISAQLRMTDTLLANAASKRMETAGITILRIRERLEAISPMQVLQRGYTLATDREGRILTGVQEAINAGNINIRFSDGTAEAAVKGSGVQEP